MTGQAHHPYRTYAPVGYCFTLLFEGLDKSCALFDFYEYSLARRVLNTRYKEEWEDVYTVEIA